MSTYVTLGSRGPVKGVSDPTGNNVGNWTVSFTPDILSFTVPQAEVYKMIVKGASQTSQFDVYVENKQWDTAVYGAQNSWDPNETLIIRPGETLYFYYNTPVTDNSPPIITIWLKYDKDIVRGML
jgi:hypothetical protein